ncbi:hypothetical protein TELCIR_07391 [Teladorsagia circumcincta]|uniref:Uncharacterized protein n=1 Tax=Teladorsagia circumcincta TaxID=45464 RepID=A0A2G9UKF5_TELCI|nr:hypothetical protein TELCIR_07391 [Teladorsagia circumcincta]
MVKKLDVLSNELMINMIRSSYTCCGMVSEENDNVSTIALRLLTSNIRVVYWKASI